MLLLAPLFCEHTTGMCLSLRALAEIGVERWCWPVPYSHLQPAVGHGRSCPAPAIPSQIFPATLIVRHPVLHNHRDDLVKVNVWEDANY